MNDEQPKKPAPPNRDVDKNLSTSKVTVAPSFLDDYNKRMGNIVAALADASIGITPTGESLAKKFSINVLGNSHEKMATKIFGGSQKRVGSKVLGLPENEPVVPASSIMRQLATIQYDLPKAMPVRNVVAEMMSESIKVSERMAETILALKDQQVQDAAERKVERKSDRRLAGWALVVGIVAAVAVIVFGYPVLAEWLSRGH